MTETSEPASLWDTPDIDVDRYLELLGLERSQPDLPLLETLHERHVRVFPFANVDVLLGRHPGVDPAIVSRRMLVERTGGYCFEHAQLFAAACESLGYRTIRHLGRVHSPLNTRTHMSVEVVVDDIRYLTDPGFGLSVTGPIALEDGASRVESHGEFTVHRGDTGGVETWELRRRGATQHVLDTLPLVPADVRSGHVVTSKDHKAGPFSHRLIVSCFTEDGHLSLVDTTLTIRHRARQTERQDLTASEAVDAVREIGVSLDKHNASKLLERLT